MAELLGYLALAVGFVVFGSSALAFIQSIPHRIRLHQQRDEPSRVRIRRIDPDKVHYRMAGDGHLTDLVEIDDDGNVLAEFHEQPPKVAADWLPEDDDGRHSY